MRLSSQSSAVEQPVRVARGFPAVLEPGIHFVCEHLVFSLHLPDLAQLVHHQGKECLRDGVPRNLDLRLGKLLLAHNLPVVLRQLRYDDVRQRMGHRRLLQLLHYYDADTAARRLRIRYLLPDAVRRALLRHLQV